MAITQEQRDQLVYRYVAIPNRAPDADGLAFWSAKLSSGELTLDDITQAMWDSPAAQALYPGSLTVEETVTRIYQNVLGRDPDGPGLAFWVGKWNEAGPGNEGAVLTAMINVITNWTPGGVDPELDALGQASQDLFFAKAEFGEWFALDADVPRASEGEEEGAEELALAEEGFGDVTDQLANGASIEDAIAHAQGIVQGMTLHLTTGFDQLDGGDGNDRFFSVDGTLNPFDELDGGDGRDELHMVIYGSDGEGIGGIPSGLDITNIEDVFIQTAGNVSGDLGHDEFASTWEGMETLRVVSVLSDGAADVTLATSASDWIQMNGDGNVSITDFAVRNMVEVVAGAHGSIDVSDVAVVDLDAGGDADVDAGDVADLDVVAGDDADVDAGALSDADVTAGDSASVTAGDVNDLDVTAGEDVTIFTSDATDIDVIAGEDVEIDVSDAMMIDVTAGEDVDIDAGNKALAGNGNHHIGSVNVTSGEDDVDIRTGTISDTTIWGAHDITIAADTQNELDLTVGATFGDLIVGSSWGSDGAGPGVLNLEISSFSIFDVNDSDEDFGDYVNTSSLNTINVTSANFSSVELNTWDIADTLTTIDGSTMTGYVDVTALVLPGAELSVSTGKGSEVITVTASDGSILTINSSDGHDWIDVNGGHDVDIAINAGEGINNVDVDAGNGAIVSITAGSDADDINVAASSDNSVVTIDAGEGHNTVDTSDVDDGQVNIAVGDGDDFVRVDNDSLEISESSVDLGAGTNIFAIQDVGTWSEGDVDAFDITFGGSVTGHARELELDVDIHLASDSASTLDVSGLSDTIDRIEINDLGAGTSDGSFNSISDTAALTITGTSDDLLIESNDDFGSDGDYNDQIALTVDGVKTLTIDADDHVNISLDGSDNADLHTINLNAGPNFGDNAFLDVSGFSNNADITMTAGSNVELRVSDSALGSVSLTAEDDDAELHIDGGTNNTVTISDVTLDSGYQWWTGSDDGYVWDGDEGELHIDANSDATITIGTVDIDAENAHLEISDNVAGDDDTTITIGDVDMHARSDDGADLDVSIVNNDDRSIDGELEINIGNMTLTSSDDVDINISDNQASAVTIGSIDVTAKDYVDVNISDNNSDTTITISDITVDGDDGFHFDIFGNNDSEVRIGDLTVTGTSDADTSDASLDITGNGSDAVVVLGDVNMQGGEDVSIDINDNSDSGVRLGDITLTAGSDGWIDVEDNNGGSDSGGVDLGNVSITAGEDAWVNVQDNYSGADLDVGNITLVAGSDSGSDAWVDIDNNSDADIDVGDIDLTAGGDTDFDLTDNCDADIDIGSVTMSSGESATFNVDGNSDSSVSGGDVTISASDDITFDLEADAAGAPGVLNGFANISLTAGDAVDADISDAHDLMTVSITANSDSSLDLDNLSDAPVSMIDLSGVGSDATIDVDASDADFFGSQSGVTIKIGDSDVNYLNDNSDSDNSREIFQFVGDDIGTIVIGSRVAGAGDDTITTAFNAGDAAQVDGEWTDRLDFSQFDGVDSIDDLTISISDADADGVNDDIVIGFVDPSLAGASITLVGAADTTDAGTTAASLDVAAESIIF